MSTSPAFNPPTGAVNVNVSVLPDDEALVVVGATVSVPAPSVPIVTCGELARLVSTPLASDFSWTGNVAVPAEPGAVTVPNPEMP